MAPELRVRIRKELGCTPQEIYGTAEGLINMTRLTDTDRDDVLLESSGTRLSATWTRSRCTTHSGNRVPGRGSGRIGHPRPAPRFADITTLTRLTPKLSRLTGFYRMGDIVRKQGRYVYTEGRRKDLINRGGGEKDQL